MLNKHPLVGYSLRKLAKLLIVQIPILEREMCKGGEMRLSFLILKI